MSCDDYQCGGCERNSYEVGAQRQNYNQEEEEKYRLR